MRRILGFAVVVGFMASAASATQLNVSVESGGMNAITVAPGEMVEYAVVGVLSDTDNRGLALVGFDLELIDDSSGLQADALGQADTPLDMSNFANPDGLNNPAGYGGTIIDGKLVQCGGAQNTINNTVDCTVDEDCPGSSNLCDAGTCTASAPFPTGTVMENIGHTAVTLATGSFTAPAAAGDYTLELTSLFLNLIATDQSGTGDLYWATVQGDAGAITNLSVTVQDCLATASAVSSVPPAEGSLWRSQKNIVRITFDAALDAAPGASEVEINELLPDGQFGPDLSESFTFAVEGGNVLRLQDNADTLVHRTWYTVRNVGNYRCVNTFRNDFVVQMGDCDGNGLVISLDVGCVNAGIPCFTGCGDDNRKDIDGDGRVISLDVGVVNGHIGSFTVPKPTGH